eukprot:5522641-Amphidinium_carterae.1
MSCVDALAVFRKAQPADAPRVQLVPKETVDVWPAQLVRPGCGALISSTCIGQSCCLAPSVVNPGPH